MKDKKSSKKNKGGQENGFSYRYGDSVRNAMNGYIGRGGIFGGLLRRIDALRRPRFLISGSPGSGKTMLAAKSGLPYEFVYPDGGIAGKHGAPTWFFSENAAYIDVPGEMSEPQRWGAFCAALQKHRFGRRRAADGLLLVVDVCELLRMDQPGVGKMAHDLREQADTLASATGYDVPVYFIFSKIDRMEGGRELLSDNDIYDSMPVLGTLFGDDDSQRMQGDIFSSSYQKICDDVSGLCRLRMVSGDNAEKNRALCRFLAELVLAEGKIAAFIAKFAGVPGRVSPRLGGFFLTPAHSGRILGDVIPAAKLRVRESGAGTTGYWAKKVFFWLLMAMIFASAVFGIAGSGLRDALHMRTLKSELALLLKDDPAVENQYMALEKLRQSYGYFGGVLKSPGRLIFGTGRVREKVRDAYIAASWQAMAAPAARHLEVSVAKPNQKRGGELTAQEHQLLYNDLKAYLLLTGGNRVDVDDAVPIAETFERALKGALGERYRSVDGQVLRDNINTVIKFAADGRYFDRANKDIVAAARQKLAAAPRANAVYAAVMDKLNAQRRTVPVAQIAGGSELLRYGRDISALYTRDGWEQSVFGELINASKDPFKADWVMGPISAKFDEGKLLGELVSLYGDDLCRRWLDFVRNVNVSLPADIPSIARDLERLSSRNSETRRMLAVVCSLATQPPADLSVNKASLMSVGAIKGQIANVSNKLRGGVNSFAHDVRDPFADARKTFGVIDTFLTGGGFDDYSSAMSHLSESLKQCDERGAFAPVFVSRGDDPLKVARRGLAKSYAAMPASASAAIRRVIESPLDITGGILAIKISAEIEESWNAEVVAHFNTRLASRNPFNKSGADLSWGDFEEFFRPNSGILWKYQEKNLAGLMELTHRGWQRAPSRSQSVRASVSDDVVLAYNRAAKIADHFFRANGAPKRPYNTFYPFIPPAPAARQPPQGGSEAMSSEMAMRGFSVPRKVLRD